jgi:hypothetical protein
VFVDSAAHVFAGDPNGHLLEFYKSEASPWQVFDHTPEVGGASISPGPAVFVDSATHLFAAGTDGHLLEFYKSGANPWQVFDHTAEVGGTTVNGRPAVYSEGPGAALHLFARGANNHLLEFYKLGASPWQVFDHTPEVGGTTISRPPMVFVDSATHVLAAGTDGHLLEFYKSGANPWQVFDHTAEVGGTTVNGSSAVYSEGSGVALHLFCRGSNNHLLEFYKSGTDPWRIFDHTPEVGGAAISSDPAVFVDNATHVFAAGTDGHLLEFYKSGANPWQVFDHTAEVGGTTVNGTPAVYSEGAGGALHLFAAGNL